MRVQKIEGESYVALTAEAIEHFGLREGQAVDIKVEPTVDTSDTSVPVRPQEVRYITVAEGLESFERTEPFHRNTYRELAK